MTANDRMMERIKALLRKADPERNDNEHERDMALRAANQLLLKHGLAMADLGDVDGSTQPGREFEHSAYFATEGSNDEWRGTLLHRLARIYFCTCYSESHRRTGTRRLFLVGRGDYVAMCRTMYEFVAPQLERELDVELLKITRTTSPHQQSQARHAREYARMAAMANNEDPTALSDDELAVEGQRRFAWIAEESGMDAALLDIVSACDVSLNFAKKVRAFVKRGDIAGEPIEDLGVWRRSFYDGAISRVAARLRELVNVEVKDMGEAGTSLVRNERADLDEFLDSLNLNLRSRTSNRRADWAGRSSGDAAGRRADLSVGRKVSRGIGTRQIGA